jgi:hypothetical protein
MTLHSSRYLFSMPLASILMRYSTVVKYLARQLDSMSSLDFCHIGHLAYIAKDIGG